MSDKNIARLKMLKAGGTRGKWAENDDLLMTHTAINPYLFSMKIMGVCFGISRDRPLRQDFFPLVAAGLHTRNKQSHFLKRGGNDADLSQKIQIQNKDLSKNGDINRKRRAA